jgi:hypothetical protein
VLRLRFGANVICQLLCQGTKTVTMLGRWHNNPIKITNIKVDHYVQCSRILTNSCPFALELSGSSSLHLIHSKLNHSLWIQKFEINVAYLTGTYFTGCDSQFGNIWLGYQPEISYWSYRGFPHILQANSKQEGAIQYTISLPFRIFHP